MKYFKIVIVFLYAATLNGQQAFEDFLQAISSNNRSLSSARLFVEAEKLKAYTGIYLPNPEIEYEYLSATDLNSSELIVAQSFEFPTVYSHKHSIAELSASQAGQGLRSKTREIYAEALDVYVEQIANNRKLNIYRNMEQMLLDLDQKARKALEMGEITVLESNRIRSETARARIDVRRMKNKSMALENRLVTLNGNVDIQITDSVYPHVLMPFAEDSLVDYLIETHPEKMFWEQEIEKAENNISLMKATGLPNFQLGYKQETSSPDNGYGFVAGMSIPLFENKNTVKLAKARSTALNEEYQSEILFWRQEYTTLINSYNAAKLALEEMELLTGSFSTLELLEKAYLSGQINYTEFFSEYSNYRETLSYLEDLRLAERKLLMELYVIMNY